MLPSLIIWMSRVCAWDVRGRLPGRRLTRAARPIAPLKITGSVRRTPQAATISSPAVLNGTVRLIRFAGSLGWVAVRSPSDADQFPVGRQQCVDLLLDAGHRPRAQNPPVEDRRLQRGVAGLHRPPFPGKPSRLIAMDMKICPDPDWLIGDT